MRPDPQPPETAAVWVPVEQLKPWAQNPRKNDGAVDEVMRSIRRFGFGAPLLAREADGEIIAGHTRYKAALKLGLKQVPVRFLRLDPVDAHLLALADNKTGEIAEWDDAALGKLLAELRQQEVNLVDGIGFSDDEIRRLIGDSQDAGTDVPDDTAVLDRPAALQQKWGTEVGQLWEIPSQTVAGRAHRVLCGDSTDVAAVAHLLAGERATWMWTDPPYGVSYVGKTGDALEIENDGTEGLPLLLAGAFSNADRVLDDGAPIYVAHPAGPLSLEFGRAFVATGWHLHQTLVWVKDTMVLGHSDYHYQHEPLLYGWKDKNRSWFGGRDKVSTLMVARPDRSELHPTMKPPLLIAHCLENSSARGSLGFEPFAGSGSTLVAAEQLGRLCCGIELDPRYVAVVLERLEALGLEPQRVA